MGMSQSATQQEEKKYQQWRFKEAVEIEHQKQKLRDERELLRKERLQLEGEKRQLLAEKNDLLMKQQAEEHRFDYEKQLFDMKWKILEGELKKLVAEKEQLERQKEFYRYVSEFEGYESCSNNVVRGEMFFCGVDSEDSLKKRYKDLIKIYHPDNICGDKTTLQEINCEYEKLLALYEA